MIAQMLTQLSPQKFYEHIFGRSLLRDSASSPQIKVNCPFHRDRLGEDDSSASLSVNLAYEHRGQFYCHGCHAKGGNYVQFWQQLKHIDPLNTELIIAGIVAEFKLDIEEIKRSIVDETKISKWVSQLHENERLLEHLLQKRMLTPDIIAEFQLGWDKTQRRLTIPIYNQDRDIVNVRFWQPEYDRQYDAAGKLVGNKIFSLPDARHDILFPYATISEPTIILSEGELDTILLHSMGFKAMTSISGVNTFNLSWSRLFINKNIVIMFDDHAPSQLAADKVIGRLTPVCQSIKPVLLKNIEGFKGKDVTELIHQFGRAEGSRYLRELVEKSAFYHEKDELYDERDKINLFMAPHPNNIGKKVVIQAVVASMEDTPYIVSKQVHIACSAKKAVCKGCPKFYGKDEDIRYVDLEGEEIANLCSMPNAEAALRKSWKLDCKNVTIEESKEYEAYQDVILQPDTEVDPQDKNYGYFLREALIRGHDLQLNGRYKFMGTTVRGRNQRAVLVISQTEQLNSLLVGHSPNEEVTCDGETKTVYEHLKIFQVASNESVNDKLTDIYSQFEEHVTRIVGRPDVLQLVDLTYHSALSFDFGGITQKWGWISSAIIGDTHCGKSETVIKYKNHVKLGERLNGESTTAVGILGGYVETAGSRGLKYKLGAGPRNNGRLLIIDEAGGMRPEDIGALTEMRSSGEARSTKAGQDNTYKAEVRMIMIGNPKDGFGRTQMINSFQYGVEAIRSFFREAADVSRFDFITTVASNEVKYEDVNAPIQLTSDLDYTSDKSNLLLNWVWSRKASHYRFSVEAQQAVRRIAIAMANQYDESIPLVSPASQRWKIARTAAAIANRLFSTTDGVYVDVTINHVNEAARFLYSLYNKKSMAYNLFSLKKKVEATVIDPATLRQILDAMPYELYLGLIENTNFVVSSLTQLTGCDSHIVQSEISKLKRLHCVTERSSKLVLTPGARAFLQNGYEHPKHKSVSEDIHRGVQDAAAGFN